MNTIEAVRTYVVVKAHDFLDESRIENSTMVVDHLQVTKIVTHGTLY